MSLIGKNLERTSEGNTFCSASFENKIKFCRGSLLPWRMQGKSLSETRVLPLQQTSVRCLISASACVQNVGDEPHASERIAVVVVGAPSCARAFLCDPPVRSNVRLATSPI